MTSDCEPASIINTCDFNKMLISIVDNWKGLLFERELEYDWKLSNCICNRFKQHGDVSAMINILRC